MDGDVEIPASDLKKHHIIKIDGSWCSIMDVKNDKLGGPHKNVWVVARSIKDDSKMRQNFQDVYMVQVMPITVQPDIQWIDRKNEDEIFAMGKNGEELIADVTHDVNESNVTFIFHEGKLIALNSKFISKR